MENTQRLTSREQEILELLSKGWTNNSIARKMDISINTVKYHLKKIFVKLNAKNRIEALNKFHTRDHSTII